MIFGQPKPNQSFRQLQPVFGQQPGGRKQTQPQFGTQRPQMDPYYSNAVGPQAQKDTAAFGALGGLGVAGLNATGQYGVARDTNLANQGIAAANMAGMMGNAYYNTIGQLGNYAAGLSAAGLNAGAQSASANMGGSFDFGTGGNFHFGGGGGGGGFKARGPEGTISSGRTGGAVATVGSGGGFGAGFNNRGSGGYNATITKGSSPQERAGLINQGYGFLGGLVGNLNDPNNQAMSMAKLAQNEFGANRAAIMDPSILNSLNSQVDRGYGAVNDVYDRSDYGFNTGRRPQQPGIKQIQAQPDYWKNPFGSGGAAWAKPTTGYM